MSPRMVKHWQVERARVWADICKWNESVYDILLIFFHDIPRYYDHHYVDTVDESYRQVAWYFLRKYDEIITHILIEERDTI